MAIDLAGYIHTSLETAVRATEGPDPSEWDDMPELEEVREYGDGDEEEEVHWMFTNHCTEVRVSHIHCTV